MTPVFMPRERVNLVLLSQSDEAALWTKHGLYREPNVVSLCEGNTWTKLEMNLNRSKQGENWP